MEKCCTMPYDMSRNAMWGKPFTYMFLYSVRCIWMIQNRTHLKKNRRRRWNEWNERHRNASFYITYVLTFLIWLTNESFHVLTRQEERIRWDPISADVRIDSVSLQWECWLVGVSEAKNGRTSTLNLSPAKEFFIPFMIHNASYEMKSSFGRRKEVVLVFAVQLCVVIGVVGSLSVILGVLCHSMSLVKDSFMSPFQFHLMRNSSVA